MDADDRPRVDPGRQTRRCPRAHALTRIDAVTRRTVLEPRGEECKKQNPRDAGLDPYLSSDYSGLPMSARLPGDSRKCASVLILSEFPPVYEISNLSRRLSLKTVCDPISDATHHSQPIPGREINTQALAQIGLRVLDVTTGSGVCPSYTLGPRLTSMPRTGSPGPRADSCGSDPLSSSI
jgi:hypothetical protein